MAYYRTGTVSINNASATVTGVGTAWVANARVGQQIQIGQSFSEEIIAVVSDTELTLGGSYEGSNLAGVAYQIIPVRGDIGGLITRTDALLTSFETIAAGPGAGKFADGSAAAPALTFLTDQDTGLFHKGANAIGVAAGGAEVADFSPSGMSITGLLSGTAVTQSDLDTTSGRLTKVGDFGIGATTPAYLGDLDSHTTVTGFYGIGTGTLGTRPAGASNFGFIWVIRQALTGILQLWFNSNGNVAAYRTATSGVWSAWITLHNSSFSGSNANGEFQRFTNGLQICTHTLNVGAADTADGNVFAAASGTGWTFPAEFAAGTIPVALPGNNTNIGAGIWFASYGTSNTSAFFKPYRAVSSAAVPNVNVTAIGQWF